ncbi:hypothetical protein [Demequina aurantiaca]|uniref:hypothetical protein n=1 Tax=Demequina aurantiaca TaxID=676200 RepID=UPI000780689A|nr:hypothetical protein [Demequina aurantiaca]
MATTPSPESQPTAPATPGETSASADAPKQSRTARASEVGTSFLESLRRNRMGVLTAALVVAFVLGLLLSVLVPNKPGAFAMIILGAFMAAAVGFTVRYLSEAKGLLTQIVAFVATGLGVHIMAITGAASGSVSALEQFGASGPGFNDALLIALATPAISAGGVLAGLVAAIIVGWGEKPSGRIDLD